MTHIRKCGKITDEVPLAHTLYKLGGNMENKMNYLTPEVVLEPVDSTMLLSASEEDNWTGNY